MKYLTKNRDKIELSFGLWGLFFLGFATISNLLKDISLEIGTFLVLTLFVFPMGISGAFAENKFKHRFIFLLATLAIIVFSGNSSFWKILVNYWWFLVLGYIVFYIAYFITHTAKNIYDLNDIQTKIEVFESRLRSVFLQRIDHLLELTKLLESLPRTFFKPLSHYLEIKKLKEDFLANQEDQCLFMNKVEELAEEIFEEIKYHPELYNSKVTQEIIKLLKRNETLFQKLKTELNAEIALLNKETYKIAKNPVRRLLVNRYVPVTEAKTCDLELSIL